MKFAYYKTGSGNPTHNYVKVPAGRTPEQTVQDVGGEKAELVHIFTSEEDAKARLSEDTDLPGEALSKGQDF